MAAEPILEIDHLIKRVGQGENEITILQGAGWLSSLKKQSRWWGIRSGKSTLLGIIAGLMTRPPVRVKLLGSHCRSWMRKAGKTAGAGCRFCVSVLCADPDPNARRMSSCLRCCAVSPESVSRECRAVADPASAGKRLKHMPAQLSGGEQIAVAIARAFSTRRKFCLPMSRPATRLPHWRQIADLLFSLNRDYGTTLILVNA